MRGGGQTVVQAQPNYQEALEQSLQAQVDLLRGTGEFTDTGGLKDLLLEYEAPLRKATAQTDTDVLRQTLLGTEREMKVQQDPETGKFGISGAEVVTDDDGNAQTAGNGRYQIVKLKDEVIAGKSAPRSDQVTRFMETPPTFGIIDTKTGGVAETIEFTEEELAEIASDSGTSQRSTQNTLIEAYANAVQEKAIERSSLALNRLQGTIDEAGGDPDAAEEAVAAEFTFTNPNIPTDASKAGQTGYDDKGNRLLEGGQNVAEQTITVREGDGMVDLLGDRREIVDYQTRQATEADVAAGLASEVGESITEAVQTGRQAGFSETGEFQGASALAEDIQAGNLSRQRERDISDVERLSGRFQNIMEDYRPAAATGISDAKLLLTQQRENLTGLREATQADVDKGDATKIGEMIQTGTGDGVISIPKNDTFGGKLGAVTVADPNTLSASTKFSGDAAVGKGVGGEDTLRSLLLADARDALSDELTDREKARISEAFKGQSTMMGRTFDQSAGIAEAQAQTLEDRNRQMQNRAFAQSALGQESGLQQGDIARAMGLELDQANLQQRTDLAQADIDTRRGIADQAQRQQANQFKVGAQMDAERLNEQLRQQGLANYIGAVGNLAAIEDQYTLDPFAAILGRGGGGSLQAGQGVFGQAGYGLQSAPQYLNPEAGLGYISQMAANDANIAAAQAAASGSTMGGLFQGLGAIGGGYLQGKFCWVAREVYGPTNPSWLRFRLWMFSESPDWFFKLYGQYGERFAFWISDKPRIKSFIRKWMDSKIKE